MRTILNYDMSRCDNTDCPKRKECKRYATQYTDNPKQWVSLCTYQHEDCEMFIPISADDKKKLEGVTLE